MAEIKFTDDELVELRNVQQSINDILIKLGQLEINRINLDLSRKEIELEYIKNMEIQRDLAKRLSDKYGNGVVDPVTGIFSPTVPTDRPAEQVKQ